MGFPVSSRVQGFRELLLIEPDFCRQLAQRARVTDVLSFLEKCCQDPVVVFIALALFFGKLIALESEMGIGLG